MTKTKQTIIVTYQEKLNDDIESVRKRSMLMASGLWEYLPEGLPAPTFITTTYGNNPWLTYPFNRETMATIRVMFEAYGWEVNSERKEHELEHQWADPYIEFKYTDRVNGKWYYVTCAFDASKAGSTCKKVVIGKTQKEVDVVEFQCNDHDNS